MVSEDTNTGHLITYSPADEELHLDPEVWCSCGFVRIISDNDLPTFARIKMFVAQVSWNY